MVDIELEDLSSGLASEVSMNIGQWLHELRSSS